MSANGSIYFGPCACNICFGGTGGGFTPPGGFDGWGGNIAANIHEVIWDFRTLQVEPTDDPRNPNYFIAAPLLNNARLFDPALRTMTRIKLGWTGFALVTPPLEPQGSTAAVQIYRAAPVNPFSFLTLFVGSGVIRFNGSGTYPIAATFSVGNIGGLPMALEFGAVLYTPFTNPREYLGPIIGARWEG